MFSDIPERGVSGGPLGPDIPVPEAVLRKILELLGGSIVFDGGDIHEMMNAQAHPLREASGGRIEFYTVRDPWQITMRLVQ